MDKVIEEANEILAIAQEIYQIEEQNNPSAIFQNKIFKKLADGKVFVERDYEKKDKSYYFTTLDMNGAIIKRENGRYCIKACVKYKNANNQDLWFAKIRIEYGYDGNIQIMGAWSGSWEQKDYEDEDLTKNPNLAFPVALNSMKNHLLFIYQELCQNNGLNTDLYDSEATKELKRFNK